MKKTNFYLSLPFVLLTTVGLLTVPLIAMYFNKDLHWTLSDFIIMGALIFGTGSIVVTTLRRVAFLAHRIALMISIGATFFMIWVNLAVGLVGARPNAANLMLLSVALVLATGLYVSKFEQNAMKRTMYATACAVIFIGLLVLAINKKEGFGASSREIILMISFLATPYFAAALILSGSSYRNTGADCKM